MSVFPERNLSYPELRRRRMLPAALAFIALAVSLLWRDARSQSQADPEVLRAKAVLEAAIQKDPENSELWLHLGFVFKKLGDVDAAQAAFENSVRLNPKNAGAHYMLGLIYEKKKRTEQAIAAWKACLEHAKDDNMREIARKHLAHLQK